MIDGNTFEYDQKSSPKIPIMLFGISALIFNLKDIKKLRIEYGITGVFSGTLPMAPQQNLLLGLPLRLSIYEIIYLLDLNLVYLVPIDLGDALLTTNTNTTRIKEFNEQLQLQTLLKEKELKSKISKLGLEHVDKDDNDINKEIFFIETSNSNDSLMRSDSLSVSIKSYEAQKRLLLDLIRKYIECEPKEMVLDNYKTFKFLKSQDQFILPGLRFGESFISYPGDPLRYHAHHTVSVRNYKKDDIGLLDIAVGGRLATGVKKLLVVSGEKETNSSSVKSHCDEKLVDCLYCGKETETVCFSFEWAGFG